MRLRPNKRFQFFLESSQPTLPAAGFTYVDNHALEITFTDTSTDPDGTIDSWNWDFGDMTGTSSLQNPVYTYASPGTYEVTLTVTDNDMNEAEVTIEIIVNDAPTANFTFVDNNGNEINFTDTSTDSDGTIVEWAWDFGDMSGTSTLQNPTYTYASPGTYNVELTVTDNRGGTDTVIIEVTPNVAPSASFTYTPTGLQVDFVDTSTDSDGTVDEWSWDFGDMTGTSTLQDPTYTYAAAGTYEVTLTVTDNDGATDVTSTEITVEEVSAAPAIRNIMPIDSFNQNVQESDFYSYDIQETDLLLIIHGTDSLETVADPVYLSDLSSASFTKEDGLSSNITLDIWSKEAAVADEGKDFRVTWGSIERSIGTLINIKNHNGVEGIAHSDFNSSTGTPTATPTSPSITTTVDNCLIIRGLLISDNNSGSYEYPTHPTSTNPILFNKAKGGGGGGVILALATHIQETAGATGTAQWTQSASRNSTGFTIAIAPGSKGGTTPSITTNLVEMWDLEDATASQSSPANDLTLVNSPTFTTGKIGNALSTTELTKYAESQGSGLYPGTNNFSINFWIYLDSTDPNYMSGIRAGVSMGRQTASGPSWSVDHRPNINAVLLSIDDDITPRAQYINTNMEADAWQMWTATYHRKGFMTFTKNGINYGGRYIGDYNTVDFIEATVHEGLNIGYGHAQGTTRSLFDSVIYYIGRVLEYETILEIYNEGNGIASTNL